jgi:hypothetical protein
VLVIEKPKQNAILRFYVKYHNEEEKEDGQGSILNAIIRSNKKDH